MTAQQGGKHVTDLGLNWFGMVLNYCKISIFIIIFVIGHLNSLVERENMAIMGPFPCLHDTVVSRYHDVS